MVQVLSSQPFNIKFFYLKEVMGTFDFSRYYLFKVSNSHMHLFQSSLI